MSFWRETRDDDQMRTQSLLEAVDSYEESGDDAFDAVVTTGLACGEACTEYPPAGHGYPRRG